MTLTRFVKAVTVALVLLAWPAFAQPATVAVFTPTATNPNTSTPVATPTQYSTPVCGQVPKFVETPPLVDVTDGAYDDPADASKDCVLSLATQFGALPKGQTYKAALKLGTGTYGPFTTAFSMSAAQAGDVCSPPDPTTGTVVAGTRTLTWCYPENATGGSPITGWAVYVDGVRSLPTVTTGAVQASGRRVYTTSITVAAGTRSIQVAPINAIGEGANKSPVFSLSVQAPATTPTGTAGIRGVN